MKNINGLQFYNSKIISKVWKLTSKGKHVLPNHEIKDAYKHIKFLINNIQKLKLKLKEVLPVELFNKLVHFQKYKVNLPHRN